VLNISFRQGCIILKCYVTNPTRFYALAYFRGHRFGKADMTLGRLIVYECLQYDILSKSQVSHLGVSYVQMLIWKCWLLCFYNSCRSYIGPDCLAVEF
jgi:hypothetical protein